jgi:Na+/H+ antiporter NhaC
MVAMVPAGLAYTGIRSLREDAPMTFWNVVGSSSGSTAVLWSVLSAVVFAGLIYRLQGIMKVDQWIDVSLKGAAGLLPLGILMMLAFAIGRLCGDNGLGTGDFVASVVGEGVPRPLIIPLLFLIAGGIAFSTGTSWGTFAIMLAIAIPLGERLNIRQELLVAAVLGGGVFGDHCSPISDTTVVSSMAAASDHIDHVRTQLPYALAAGFAALVLFSFAGFCPR